MVIKLGEEDTDDEDDEKEMIDDTDRQIIDSTVNNAGSN